MPCSPKIPIYVGIKTFFFFVIYRSFPTGVSSLHILHNCSRSAPGDCMCLSHANLNFAYFNISPAAVCSGFESEGYFMTDTRSIQCGFFFFYCFPKCTLLFITAVIHHKHGWHIRRPFTFFFFFSFFTAVNSPVSRSSFFCVVVLVLSSQISHLSYLAVSPMWATASGGPSTFVAFN